MTMAMIESKDFLGYTVRGLDPLQLERGDRFLSRVFGIYEVLSAALDSLECMAPDLEGKMHLVSIRRVSLQVKRPSTGDEREVRFFEGDVANPATGEGGSESDLDRTDDEEEPEAASNVGPIPLPCMFEVARDPGDERPGTILGCNPETLDLGSAMNGLVKCARCGFWSEAPVEAAPGAA